jgi:hypothetical protein
MIQKDFPGHMNDVAERKFKEAAELAEKASGTVLPLLIFSLVVAWLLGLEAQITPQFLEISQSQHAMEHYEVDVVQALRLKAETLQKEQNKLNEAAEAAFEQMRKDGDQKKVVELAQKQQNNFAEVEKLEEELKNVREKLDPFLKTVADLDKKAKSVEADAKNVEFKLPLLEIKIPRLAAPLGWCLVAMGTLLYLFSLRQRVCRLLREGRECGVRAEVPTTHLDDLSAIRCWWLNPLPTAFSPSSPSAAAKTVSVALWAFWAVLGLGALRMICLGHHLLAIEKDVGFLSVFFVLSTGTTAVILFWLGRWVRSSLSFHTQAEQEVEATTEIEAKTLHDVHGRRHFLQSGLAFGAGVLGGTIILRFFKPMTISAIVARVQALKPKPSRSPVFSARRRKHTADLPEHPAGGPGEFVKNAGNNTLHYIFPYETYGQNRPQSFRPRGPRTKRPNPAPEDDFIRWSPAPRKLAPSPSPAVMLPAVVTDQNALKDIPHVALKSAASSFEHFIIHSALSKGDLATAVQLGLLAIRHDLSYHSNRPNFRIYDLTAGLMARMDNRHGLFQLAQTIQQSHHRNLFAHRIAKWLQPDSKWAERWKNKVAIVWANQIISPALLK